MQVICMKNIPGDPGAIFSPQFFSPCRCTAYFQKIVLDHVAYIWHYNEKKKIKILFQTLFPVSEWET